MFVAGFVFVIVFETAERSGVRVSFSEYSKAGLPITLATSAIAWGWLSIWGTVR